MAASEVIKCQFDGGSIKGVDGTSGTALECEVKFDNADLTVSGIAPDLRNHTAYQGRGELRSLRKTDRLFLTGSFSCQVADLTEASAGMFQDLVLGNAPFAARVSTSAAIGDVTTLDLVFVFEGTDYGDAADGTFTLEDCHITFDFAMGDPNTITFNFTGYGDIAGDLAQAAA